MPLVANLLTHRTLLVIACSPLTARILCYLSENQGLKGQELTKNQPCGRETAGLELLTIKVIPVSVQVQTFKVGISIILTLCKRTLLRSASGLQDPCMPSRGGNRWR